TDTSEDHFITPSATYMTYNFVKNSVPRSAVNHSISQRSPDQNQSTYEARLEAQTDAPRGGEEGLCLSRLEKVDICCWQEPLLRILR
ncbi:hypothetical protein JOQ06_012190, partial [Pogonophryne albipinna]